MHSCMGARHEFNSSSRWSRASMQDADSPFAARCDTSGRRASGQSGLDAGRDQLRAGDGAPGRDGGQCRRPEHPGRSPHRDQRPLLGDRWVHTQLRQSAPSRRRDRRPPRGQARLRNRAGGLHRCIRPLRPRDERLDPHRRTDAAGCRGGAVHARLTRPHRPRLPRAEAPGAGDRDLERAHRHRGRQRSAGRWPARVDRRMAEHLPGQRPSGRPRPVPHRAFRPAYPDHGREASRSPCAAGRRAVSGRPDLGARRAR